MDKYREVIAYDTCQTKDMANALEEGWQPWGSAYPVRTGKHEYDVDQIQPVVKYKPEE